MANELSPDEERDLIAKVTEPDAFRQLYRHYFPRVYAYVAHRVGRETDAEDVTSGIFTKVVENVRSFEYRGEGSFSAWLFRIAYNEVQQFYRNTQRTVADIPLQDAPMIRSESQTPDEALQAKEQYLRLQAMVETLSPRRREVISLRFFGGLRNQEIAQVLDLDERSVASHLSRGLTDLQRKYGPKDVSA